MLSEKATNISPAATIEISARIAELRRQGINIISLNIGEPDYPTPENISQAQKGDIRYKDISGPDGVPDGKVDPNYDRKKFKTDNGLTYRPNEICVSAGAKQAVFNAVFVLCGEGDEVIIPTPCWVSYSEIVKLVGATPVYVPCAPEENFDLNLTGIRSAISSRTKAILINTPNNPTGAVYSEQTLRALGELAVEHGFTIISDEIYEKMVYDGAEHISTASLSPEIYRHCITINGFSKAYAMPGWRIGYSAAPLEVTTAIKAVQGHVTSAANSIAQKAALEALSGPQDTVAVMCGEYARRRSRVAQRLQEIPGVRFSMPSGAFYFWVDVSAYLGKSHGGKKINTAVDLANFLLEQAHAAVVPGEAFHMPGSIRISYANSMKNIELALTAIKEALALL